MIIFTGYMIKLSDHLNLDHYIGNLLSQFYIIIYDDIMCGEVSYLIYKVCKAGEGLEGEVERPGYQ